MSEPSCTIPPPIAGHTWRWNDSSHTWSLRSGAHVVVDMYRMQDDTLRMMTDDTYGVRPEIVAAVLRANGVIP